MPVCCADAVDLFGAKPFTVPAPQSPPSVTASGNTAAAAGGDVFGMPVFSPLSPSSAFDQEMIDMQVLCLMLCVYLVLVLQLRTHWH